MDPIGDVEEMQRTMGNLPRKMGNLTGIMCKLWKLQTLRLMGAKEYG